MSELLEMASGPGVAAMNHRHPIAAACAYFLRCHNRAVGDAFAFGLSDGFISRYARGGSTKTYLEYPGEPLQILCSRIGFFYNRFMARDGRDFMSHVHENMHVKRYPFIMCVGLYDPEFRKILPHMILSHDPEREIVRLGTAAGSEETIAVDTLINRLNESHAAMGGAFEWLIFLPPKRTIKFTLLAISQIKRLLLANESVNEPVASGFAAFWAMSGDLTEQATPGKIAASAASIARHRSLWIDFLKETSRRLDTGFFDAWADQWQQLLPDFHSAGKRLDDIAAGDHPLPGEFSRLVLAEQTVSMQFAKAFALRYPGPGAKAAVHD